LLNTDSRPGYTPSPLGLVAKFFIVWRLAHCDKDKHMILNELDMKYLVDIDLG